MTLGDRSAISATSPAADLRSKAAVLLDRVLSAIIAVAAVILAVSLWRNYVADPDLLWRDFYHDRNTHFRFGLDLALAVKTFDPVWFLTELEKAKVWPPLHGLVLSAVLLFGGASRRLGIVPSLAGWAMTIVLSWLIARRLFAARVPGILAGVVAVTLTAASPAFRLLAADVMLEALGAGLSALTLFAYLRAYSEPERPANWRLLALTLTALFFHKGNYWGLVVVALAVAHLSLDLRLWLDRAHTTVRAIDVGAVARSALRDPLLIVFAIIAALVAFLYKWGPASIVLFGREVRLYPPENLTTVAYAVLFARSALGWRQYRFMIDAALGLPGRILFYWHVVPVAISFLLPKRLSAFLWFVGPANYNWQQAYDPLGGALLYWRAFAEGFHVAPWMAVFSLALAAIGMTRMWSMRPARAVFVFALLSMIAVVIHPQHQGRFLTSWVFAVWISAGAGAGVVFELFLARRLKFVQAIAAASFVVALAAANVWREPPPPAYEHAIRPTSGSPDLDLVRPYLQDLDGAVEVLVATTFGVSDLFAWTIREHCQCKLIVQNPWIDSLGSREEVRRVMAERIAQSTADRVVILNAPHGRYSLPSFGWTYELMAGIVDAMENQNRFIRLATYPLPDQSGEATVWKPRSVK